LGLNQKNLRGDEGEGDSLEGIPWGGFVASYYTEGAFSSGDHQKETRKKKALEGDFKLRTKGLGL